MLELSFSRTFVPGSESSMYGTFVPGNENVAELSFSGAKMTWNFRSRELKCCGISLSVGNGLDLPKTQMGTVKNTLMFEIVNKPYKHAHTRSLLEEMRRFWLQFSLSKH